MGLFSFLKNAGSKVFKKAEAPKAVVTENTRTAEDIAAEKAMFEQQKAFLLESIVANTNIEVENLSIAVDDDVVTISGNVEKQADKERLILAVGNVDGIATVDDRLVVEKQEEEAEFYTVKKGDSLSKIAKRYYGNALKYKELFVENQPLLKDPAKIYPGQQLRIPKNL